MTQKERPGAPTNLDRSMAAALLIGWSAAVGAVAGMTVGVLGGLSVYPALTSGEDGDLVRVVGAFIVLGAALGGIRGWRMSVRQPDDRDSE